MPGWNRWRYGHDLGFGDGVTVNDSGTDVHLDGSGCTSTSAQVVPTDASFTVGAWARLNDKSADHDVIARSDGTRSGFRVQYHRAGDRWRVSMASGSMNVPGPLTAGCAPDGPGGWVGDLAHPYVYFGAYTDMVSTPWNPHKGFPLQGLPADRGHAGAVPESRDSEGLPTLTRHPELPRRSPHPLVEFRRLLRRAGHLARR
ncbi:hypothetical protein AB0I28_25890 [Phytomonospora sp. NPDC050363]|uniref:hypothetical protein n=1 Tax=Phytomonospora sp. NPDC050363 TaxID=3155642 RepID=UPI00340247C1